MQKTLSSTQLKEMLSNEPQNHEDILLEGPNKNDQELSAEVIEKYFASNGDTDHSSGDKYIDDEDSPEEREDEEDGA